MDPFFVVSRFQLFLLGPMQGVTGHFVPRSFRTQVISYHFGHFVPTFIFNLVISYPVWSFRTHFVPRLVISYLLFTVLLFRTQVISYPKSFRTYFSHFVPTFIFNLVISYPVWSFRTHFVPSLVISYLLLLFSRKPFWSFRTYFLLFRIQVISYPKSFRT